MFHTRRKLTKLEEVEGLMSERDSIIREMSRGDLPQRTRSDLGHRAMELNALVQEGLNELYALALDDDETVEVPQLQDEDAVPEVL